MQLQFTLYPYEIGSSSEVKRLVFTPDDNDRITLVLYNGYGTCLEECQVNIAELIQLVKVLQSAINEDN